VRSRRHPSFGLFGGYRRSNVSAAILVFMVSGRIEHRNQRRLCMNASFCHGTLQLGAYRVDGEAQISGNVHGPAALCEALDDTRFRLCELPHAWRAVLHTARAC
jgi:hypothetical protein